MMRKCVCQSKCQAPRGEELGKRERERDERETRDEMSFDEF
jgi:hypothetical protein